jgi:hypothetical protein
MDMHGTGRTCTCSCRDTWLGHEYDGGLVGFGGTATYARAILQTVAAREAMMAARPRHAVWCAPPAAYVQACARH